MKGCHYHIGKGRSKTQNPARDLASILKEASSRRSKRLIDHSIHRLRRQLLVQIESERLNNESQPSKPSMSENNHNDGHQRRSFDARKTENSYSPTLDRLKSENPQKTPDEYEFNSPPILSTRQMVDILNFQKDTQIALEIFNRAGKQEGYKHNLYTYRVMIQKLLDAKYHEDAENLLNEMTAESFRCGDPAVFNSLIRSFGEALLMEAAFKVFHRMHDFCNPDVDSYNALLNALVQNKHYETAIAFFNQLGCAGIPLTVTTFNIAINALCYINRVEEAVVLLRQMHEQKWPPNVCTYNTLIR